MLKPIPFRTLSVQFFSFFILLQTNLFSQTTFPVNGAHDKRPGMYAFTNATIFIDYKTVISGATLIIEKGIVKQAGKGITIPANAIVTDLTGKFIYPSFIDLYTQYGIKPNEGGSSGRTPQYNPNTKGAYMWNDALKPYQEAHRLFNTDNDKADEYRKAGFGTVLTFQYDGITRGTSSLVALSSKKENETFLLDKAAAHYSFSRGTSTQAYPTSLMGAVALLRQTFYDAQWYSSLKDKTETHIGLEAINKSKNLPQIFEANDRQNVLRADRIGDEFGIQFIIKSSGDEYQRLDAIKTTQAPLIVSVNFPQAYDVEDPLDATLVTYKQMKHWELAPFNPYYLFKAGIPFAITSDGLKDKSSLLTNIRRAIQCGLPAAEALKSLTETPAKIIKVEAKTGALKPGLLANFLITSDSIFKEGSIIYENWVLGEKYAYANLAEKDIRGIYSFSVTDNSNVLPDSATLSISGKKEAIETEFFKDSLKLKVNFKQESNGFVKADFEWKNNKIRLSGWYGNKPEFSGVGESSDGKKFKWKALLSMSYKVPEPTDSAKKAETKLKFKADSAVRSIGKIPYPFQAYGFETLPKSRKVLIKNATVWTNEAAGVLKGADVLIESGKISKVGKLGNLPADTVIDGTNKHLTPGIIDEHSHIAINGGVNECSHSVTAEVRIGDILNEEDINIYRNLSGGVTAAQILHGSCNSIGGQSGIIKLRWGKTGDEFKIKGADEFIKFALGENVKQANWGDDFSIRFPQTRMGVEQVYADAFSRAKEYEAEWKKFAVANDKSKPAPRKDLQLDALVQILNKQRFVTCHSYVQSEIIMLMRLAESYNFTINTFTHILEGYKVADKMKAHGAGGSTFADWWAYKFEVKDAIPYNAAIMHKVGVVTAINSDDPEMSRRLNQEAAKAVKYGDISEEDALKMVTLNPAKLLHLDKTCGSIKEGKDADIVLWSDNPLSIYAKAEQTYVDGICLFDAKKDLQQREFIAKERTRLINKMYDAKKKGSAVQKPALSMEQVWDCEGDREISYE